MEFSTFIPLMVAAIQTSGQVLSSFVSRAKQVANNYIVDKAFVESTVENSKEQLEDLLRIKSLDLKREMREQGIRDVVEDLQAHIASTGRILDFASSSEITNEMAERLITNGLVPLQVSLDKAKLRLQRYGKDDLRLYCHIIGTNTLIAGYVFAGQPVPTLQKELKESAREFQQRLLDSIAQNRKLPWDKVEYLLSLDGITDLYALYNSTMQAKEKPPRINKPEEAIEIIEPDYLVKMIVGQLRNGETSYIRLEAAEKLGKFGDKSPYVVSALRQSAKSDNDPDVREQARLSLKKLGVPREPKG